jgi:two-component sensor histidine kinase
VIERTASFADRDLRFVYIVQRNVTRESLWRGVVVVGAGLGLTACAVLLIGFISGRATALANEVRSRRSAEDRLKVVIHELNHRVRNVLSVAQAVVRLSFTPGLTLGEVQRTCEGRLLALANAMSLLTASDWKGIRLRELISADIIPFAERVAFKGPDIALKARAAQTFALLLHELATNAAKHGAFSVPSGRVTLEWEIDRSGTEPLFRFVWREMGGPEVTPPKRRGFGELLVRRIAPRDISGRATVNYEAQGFCYVLEAPLHELIDASSGRTAGLSAEMPKNIGPTGT